MSGSDDIVRDLLVKQAADLAVGMSNWAKTHPLAKSEFGSLVVPLAMVHLVELQAAGVDWGDGPAAREFRNLLLAPLRRAIAKLQGPVN